MNVSFSYTKELFSLIDWEAAGTPAIDKFIKLIEQGAEARYEWDARSRVMQAWSVASFLTSIFLIASNTQTWGAAAVYWTMIAGCIITTIRSYMGNKAMQQAHEACYAMADELAHRYPKAPGQDGQAA